MQDSFGGGYFKNAFILNFYRWFRGKATLGVVAPNSPEPPETWWFFSLILQNDRKSSEKIFAQWSHPPFGFFQATGPHIHRFATSTTKSQRMPTGFSRLLLQLASPQLREDVEVVEAAVKQNPDAIRSLDAQSRARGQWPVDAGGKCKIPKVWGFERWNIEVVEEHIKCACYAWFTCLSVVRFEDRRDGTNVPVSKEEPIHVYNIWMYIYNSGLTILLICPVYIHTTPLNYSTTHCNEHSTNLFVRKTWWKTFLFSEALLEVLLWPSWRRDRNRGQKLGVLGGWKQIFETKVDSTVYNFCCYLDDFSLLLSFLDVLSFFLSFFLCSFSFVWFIYGL